MARAGCDQCLGCQMILRLPVLPRQAIRGARIVGRLLPLAALSVCLWLMAVHLRTVDLSAVWAAAAAIGTGPILLAMGLTAGSLAAVAGFELTARRMIGLAGPRGPAMRVGVAAVAIAQLAGFGALTAAFARWRGQPDLGLARATELSVVVSLAFMAALCTWAALALTVAQDLVGLSVGIAAVTVAMILKLAPGSRLPGLTPGCGAQVFIWTAIDIGFGAGVLFVLLPSDVFPGGSAFVAAYLAALVAGFLSQSPGGIGAFDLAFLALMPTPPDERLLAALLAYRLIYHVVPALAGVALLARPGRPSAPGPLQPARGPGLLRALARAPSGDWALVHQGAGVLLQAVPFGGWLVAPAGRWQVALGDPSGAATVTAFAQTARSVGQRPALYRVGTRTAVSARCAGWGVVRVAVEGWVDPRTWSPDAPACRSLRRKLRQATAAGLRIEVEPPDLPMTQMATLATLWAARHGGEKGFSMGRFAPGLVRQAVVVLAWQGPQLAGFVTLNRGQQCWTLDLMRQAPDAPDGTMQALVTAAVDAARAAGVPALSLACVPCPPDWIPHVLSRHLIRPGLQQFKASFAPQWAPRYLSTPNRFQLPLALAAIARAIHSPGPLHRDMVPPPSAHATTFGFDSPPLPCERAASFTTTAPAQQPARPPESRPHDQRPFPPA
jgi:phosphatidylglycerol lysyltransferase